MNDAVKPPSQEPRNARRIFYVLRLWRTEDPRCCDWRASLEDPETGQRIGFASLEQLFGYLMDLTDGWRCGPPGDDRIRKVRHRNA